MESICLEGGVNGISENRSSKVKVGEAEQGSMERRNETMSVAGVGELKRSGQPDSNQRPKEIH